MITTPPRRGLSASTLKRLRESAANHSTSVQSPVITEKSPGVILASAVASAKRVHILAAQIKAASS